MQMAPTGRGTRAGMVPEGSPKVTLLQVLNSCVEAFLMGLFFKLVLGGSSKTT